MNMRQQIKECMLTWDNNSDISMPLPVETAPACMDIEVPIDLALLNSRNPAADGQDNGSDDDDGDGDS